MLKQKENNFLINSLSKISTKSRHKITYKIMPNNKDTINICNSKKYDIVLIIGRFKDIYTKIKYKNVVYIHDSSFLRFQYSMDLPFAVLPHPLYKKLKYDPTLPPDRWNNLKKLTTVKPWQKTGKYILLGYQQGIMCGVNRITMNKNILYDLTGTKFKYDNLPYEVLTKNGIKIRVRYHHQMAMPELGGYINKNTLEEDLKDAMCLVTYDSNIATDAIITGVPLIVHSNHHTNFVSSSDINNLIYPNREPWFNWLAYQHWSLNDLKSDKWIDYYKETELLKF